MRIVYPLSTYINLVDTKPINPLSPNSDQHQFSPNNIHRLSSAISMRINQMITRRKISDFLSISPNEFCKEMYRNQFGEFVYGYWGLKA